MSITEQLESQLGEWRAEVERMEADAQAREKEAESKQADAAAAEKRARRKRERYEAIREVKDSIDQAEAKLNQLKESGGEKAEDLKKELNAAWHELGNRLKSLRS